MIKTLVPILFLLALPACLGPKGDTPQEKVASAMVIHDEVLAELAERKPLASKSLKEAPGYGVWRVFHVHLGLGTVAVGHGVIVDNKAKEASHTKFYRLAIGPGFAIKTFDGVIIMDKEEGIQRMKKGGFNWGVLAEASLQFGDFGGTAAAFAMRGGTAYLWTRTGVSLEAAIGIGYNKPKKDMNAVEHEL